MSAKSWSRGCGDGVIALGWSRIQPSEERGVPVETSDVVVDVGSVPRSPATRALDALGAARLWRIRMFDNVLGNSWLADVAISRSKDTLRIIAYHGVPDLDAFDRQIALLLARFVAVDEATVRSWLAGEDELRGPSVWVTFDDGEHSAVVGAAEALARRGIRPTVFVCPGFIDGGGGAGSLPWWSVVADAIDSGRDVRVDGITYSDHRAVTALKRVPDPVRRDVVAGLGVTDALRRRPTVTVDDLRRWIDLGGSIGNHTWDHPCLDRCSEVEQRSQVDRAATWLTDLGLWDSRAFAYPNGDWTATVEAHLRAEGYGSVALFDHRLCRRSSHPTRLSRLRLEAGVDARRTMAVASGLNPMAFHLREALRGRSANSPLAGGPCS